MNHGKGADAQTVKGQKLDPTVNPAKEDQDSLGTKMVRLDDLTPEQDVKGGRRVFFGGENLKSTENKP